MSSANGGDLTVLLGQIRSGTPEAQGRLVQAIYADLRRIAGGLMRGERSDHSLEASGLVHEGLLRLLGGRALTDSPDRRHLFAAAARTMRQVLVDHARRRLAAKRPAKHARVPLDEALAVFDARSLDVIALHEALDRLAQAHPRPARVVELRFFAGLSVPEVAGALDLSITSVESDWRFARAWLRDELGGPP